MPSAGESSPIVAVVGAGVTGTQVALRLHDAGVRVAVLDEDGGVASSLAKRVQGIVLTDERELRVADGIVLCQPAGHADLVSDLLRAGRRVVSISDDVDDVRELLGLDRIARANHGALLVGAGMSPGLSALLAVSLSVHVVEVEEVHVAVHGTAGPACARQHHRALGSRADGWHDGEWIERPGGSGRELSWFPEPIGAHDCYRAALADPLVLQRSFPTAMRISARVSATRRDRLTARLPMLTPPHADGDLGAVRVEVRGANVDGERVSVIAGVAGRTGEVAGAVAAAGLRRLLGDVPAGVHLTTSAAVDPVALLADAVSLGITLQEFTGVARPLAW